MTADVSLFPTVSAVSPTDDEVLPTWLASDVTWLDSA